MNQSEILNKKTADDFVKKVKSKRLNLPVSLFIEINLPLNNVFANGILFVEPMLAPFVTHNKLKELNSLLQDKKMINYILNELKE